MNKIQDFLFLSNYDLKWAGSIELNFVYNCEEYFKYNVTGVENVQQSRKYILLT